MRAATLFVISLLLVTTLYSQSNQPKIKFDISIHYADFKKDVNHSARGYKFRLAGGLSDRIDIGAGIALMRPFVTSVMKKNYLGVLVPTPVTQKFNTLSMDINYFITKPKEKGFAAYIDGGIAGIFLKYQVSDGIPEPNIGAFAVDLGLGVQYSFGVIKLFADGGMAVPLRKKENFVGQPLPNHFMCNAGLRFSFGAAPEYHPPQ